MSDKLVNIITCDNMKADVILLADGKITVMEFSQMHKKIEELEASNKELLEALEDCCVIAKRGNPASCCPVYRPGVHGGCSENEDGECHILNAIQKARG